MLQRRITLALYDTPCLGLRYRFGAAEDQDLGQSERGSPSMEVVLHLESVTAALDKYKR